MLMYEDRDCVCLQPSYSALKTSHQTVVKTSTFEKKEEIVRETGLI